MKNKTQDFYLQFSCTFGSKFQENFAIDSLEKTIEVWSNFLQTTHKKNEIKFQIIKFDKLMTKEGAKKILDECISIQKKIDKILANIEFNEEYESR